MFLKVGYAWTKVVSATAAENSFLREYLSFSEKGAMGKLKTRRLLRPGRMFPSGLTSRMVRAARAQGFDVSMSVRALTIKLNEVYEFGDWKPRAHQRAALELLYQNPRGLIQHCTGSGKGDLIAFLAARALPCRVLIITSSIKLVKDLYARCLKFGLHAGRLGGGYKEKERRVVVSTDDSLKALTEAELASFGAVLVDEAHMVAAQALWTTLMRCLNAERRYGFSATPLDRADRKGLYIVGALGGTIHKYSPMEAERDGVISKCRLRMVAHENKPVSTATGYTDWESAAIATSPGRNQKVLRLIGEYPAPRIVFVRTKEHQAELVRRIGELFCVAVNDESSAEELDAALTKLKRGGVPTLVSTPILRQGIDIAEIKTVINAAGGKAVIDVIQKIGRGSRRNLANGETKDEFWVVDFDDRGCGCLGGHKSCEWFERHSRLRREAYRKYGYTVIDI